MSARDYLHDLYGRWRSLTKQETEAIQIAAWSQVELCQVTKRELQNEIVQALEELQGELKFHGAKRADIEKEFRPLLEELIVLETRNGELLATQKQRNLRQQAEADRSTRTLRQVRGAYAPGNGPAWVSYS